MYWWNIKALKATLSSAGLSERTNVYYLLVCTVAATGGMEFMAYVPYESINLWRLVITTGYLLLAIGGTYAFYKANGGERGVRILERLEKRVYPHLHRFFGTGELARLLEDVFHNLNPLVCILSEVVQHIFL